MRLFTHESESVLGLQFVILVSKLKEFGRSQTVTYATKDQYISETVQDDRDVVTTNY